MQQLSERERISFLMMRNWGGIRRSFMQIKDLFNETFRNGLTLISKSTVERTVKRFEDTGSIKDRPRTGRLITATTEEKSLYVLQSFMEDPHCTLRKAAQEHNSPGGEGKNGR